MCDRCIKCDTVLYFDLTEIKLPSGYIEIKIEESYIGFKNQKLCRQCTINALNQLKNTGFDNMTVTISSSYFCGLVGEIISHFNIFGEHTSPEAIEFALKELKELPFK